MTDTEKITMVKTMLNDTEIADATVSVYLALAKDTLTKAEYPFGGGTLSSKYEMENIELACRLIARRGFEGQLTSNENGVIRQWSTVSDRDIIDRITPKVGIR